MALSLSVRAERTVKISALQMVNTEFPPHSSPVMNLCHNFDIVHVTLLTLYVHIKLFTNFMFCISTLCKVKMSSGCLSRRSRVGFLRIGDTPTDALISLVRFRVPLCVEADHRPINPTSTRSIFLILEDSQRPCLVAVRLKIATHAGADPGCSKEGSPK